MFVFWPSQSNISQSCRCKAWKSILHKGNIMQEMSSVHSRKSSKKTKQNNNHNFTLLHTVQFSFSALKLNFIVRRSEVFSLTSTLKQIGNQAEKNLQHLQHVPFLFRIQHVHVHSHCTARLVIDEIEPLGWRQSKQTRLDELHAGRSDLRSLNLLESRTRGSLKNLKQSWLPAFWKKGF